MDAWIGLGQPSKYYRYRFRKKKPCFEQKNGAPAFHISFCTILRPEMKNTFTTKRTKKHIPQGRC